MVFEEPLFWLIGLPMMIFSWSVFGYILYKNPEQNSDMMKEWIRKNGGWLLIGLAIIAVLLAYVIPIIITIG